MMAEERGCSNTACSEESCENCAHKNQTMKEKLNDFSKINNVIGIVSGKGGVGKSLVTASMAVKLADMGYKVGILDADITGPSIPKMFGITAKATGTEDGIFPAVTAKGIKVMSVNLLLENDDDPVIWRGPVIAGVVKQFWSDVLWGEVDYLLVDMPPGTGDVPLTVFQSLPVNGVVIVTSPQELVNMIVKKAYNMADKMNIPILGIVENYSYLECPDCGKHISVFGESHIDEVAANMGLDVLAKMPIVPEIAELADKGMFEQSDNIYITDAVKVVADKLNIQ